MLDNPMIAAQERHDASADSWWDQVSYAVEKDGSGLYSRNIAEDGFDSEDDAIEAAKKLCEKNKDDMYYVTLEHPYENSEYLHTFVWCEALGKAVIDEKWIEEV